MAKSAEIAKDRLTLALRTSSKARQSNTPDEDSVRDHHGNLEQILKHLHSTDEETRLTNLMKLEHYKVDEILTEIQPLLMDSNHHVRAHVRKIFKKAGKKATPILEILLQSPNPDEQMAAIEIASHSLDPLLVPYLTACLDVTITGQLSHTRRPVNEVAAKVLERIDTYEAQNALKQYKKRAFQRHAEEQHENYTQQLNISISDAQPDLRAIVPITHTSEKSIVNHVATFKALFAQIRNGEWADQNISDRIIQKQCQTIQGDRHPELVDYLITMLEDPNWRLRNSAIQALARLHSADAIPKLVACVEDENEFVRIAALDAIAEIGDIAAAAQIERALTDSAANVREATANVLGRLRSKSSILALVAVFNNDSDEMVRIAALLALGSIGGRTINRTLLNALNDAEVHIRFNAARILADSADEEAVPEMIIHLADTSGLDWEDRRVCDWIAEGLENVNTPKAREAVKTWRNQQSLV